MKEMKAKLEILAKEIAEVKGRRKKLRKENKTLEKQNVFLTGKIDEMSKDQELNKLIKENLGDQLKILDKGNEEVKEGADVAKKQKIIEELEKEIAAHYALIQ